MLKRVQSLVSTTTPESYPLKQYSMQQDYNFREASSTETLVHLKEQWMANLTRPQDGMWESFRNNAKQIEISKQEKVIGYACIGEGNQLLQFYVLPKQMEQGLTIFQQFIKQFQIERGMVGTNNPVYLSLALHFLEKMDIHTYLFEDCFESKVKEKDGIFRKGTAADLEKIVDFCHYSMGAPKAWLTGYIGDLIGKGEVFLLENTAVIIGTCEVRKSTAAPAYADIGMIVSPDFRKQGYGSFLLNKAKTIAIEWKKTPICSCEKGNVGSLKSIHNCGFTSKHQLLAVSF